MTTGIPICLKIDQPVYSLLLGWVIEKQNDSLSALINFGTAKNLITFHRRKYMATKSTKPQK